MFSPFAVFKKTVNLTIDLLSLGIYAPGPQVLTYRTQIFAGSSNLNFVFRGGEIVSYECEAYARHDMLLKCGQCLSFVYTRIRSQASVWPCWPRFEIPGALAPFDRHSFTNGFFVNAINFCSTVKHN